MSRKRNSKCNSIALIFPPRGRAGSRSRSRAARRARTARASRTELITRLASYTVLRRRAEGSRARPPPLAPVFRYRGASQSGRLEASWRGEAAAVLEYTTLLIVQRPGGLDLTPERLRYHGRWYF
jgi:hypothetical protein